MLQSMNTSPDPLLVANLQPDGAHSTSTYSKAMQRGQLLRLRRGVYIPTDIWLRSRPSQRYQLMLAAASLQLGSPVFCRESALQIHGLPLLELPAAVHLRASSPSTIRTSRQPPLTGRLSTDEYWRQAQASGAAAGMDFSATWFRGFSTARHTPARSQEATSCSKELLLPSASTPAEQLGRLPVRTEPADVAVVDTVPRMDFDSAVVTLDASLRRAAGQHRAEAEHLQQLAWKMIDSRRMNSYLRTRLDFASPLSESPGESLARARFHQLGFEQPQLQVSMNIDSATYRVDFLWEAAGVVGEFDGWKKYDTQFTRSMKQEKIREDAIRSTGLLVIRFYWEDLMEPGCTRLVQLLTRTGVPRASSAPPLLPT